jgi:hypothetical protein
MLTSYKRADFGVLTSPKRRQDQHRLGIPDDDCFSQFICEALVAWTRDPNSEPIASYFTNFRDLWNPLSLFDHFPIGDLAAALTIAVVRVDEPSILSSLLKMTTDFTACASDYHPLVSNFAGNLFEVLYTHLISMQTAADWAPQALAIFGNFYGDRNPSTLALRPCVPIGSICALGTTLKTVDSLKYWLISLCMFSGAPHSKLEASEALQAIFGTMDAWNGDSKCIRFVLWTLIHFLLFGTMTDEQIVRYGIPQMIPALVGLSDHPKLSQAALILAGQLIRRGFPAEGFTFQGTLKMAVELWEVPAGLTAIWVASTLLNEGSAAEFVESNEGEILLKSYDTARSDVKCEIVAVLWDMVGLNRASADWFFQHWGLFEKTLDLWSSGIVCSDLINRICREVFALLDTVSFTSLGSITEHLSDCIALAQEYLGSESPDLIEAGEFLSVICETIEDMLDTEGD